MRSHPSSASVIVGCGVRKSGNPPFGGTSVNKARIQCGARSLDPARRLACLNHDRYRGGSRRSRARCRLSTSSHIGSGASASRTRARWSRLNTNRSVMPTPKDAGLRR